ncbi:unnamed protein product, partial [Ectocarpus sp. 6 AP-2014]
YTNLEKHLCARHTYRADLSVPVEGITALPCTQASETRILELLWFFGRHAYFLLCEYVHRKCGFVRKGTKIQSNALPKAVCANIDRIRVVGHVVTAVRPYCPHNISSLL